MGRYAKLESSSVFDEIAYGPSAQHEQYTKKMMEAKSNLRIEEDIDFRRSLIGMDALRVTQFGTNNGPAAKGLPDNLDLPSQDE